MSSLKVKIFKKKKTKTSSTVAVSSKTDKEGACISSSPLYLDGTDDGAIHLLLICYFLVTSCWYHENIFFFLVHAFVHSVLAQVEHTWSKKIIITRCSCGNQSCFQSQGLGCPWVTSRAFVLQNLKDPCFLLLRVSSQWQGSIWGPDSLSFFFRIAC